LIRREYPGTDPDAEINRLEDQIDRWELFRMLLEPLERVRQDLRFRRETAEWRSGTPLQAANS
jgi:hypothetical protein